MPISQDRIIKILQAGETALNALDLAQSTCKQQLAIIHAKLLQFQATACKEREGAFPSPSMKQIFEQIETMFTDLEILLEPETLMNTAGPLIYVEAYFKLKSEIKHFKDFKAINERNKRYQKNRRERLKAHDPNIEDHITSPPINAPSSKLEACGAIVFTPFPTCKDGVRGEICRFLHKCQHNCHDTPHTPQADEIEAEIGAEREYFTNYDEEP